MLRAFLPLLPLPLLAVLSCTRTSPVEPAARVIPPAAPYVEPAARNAAAAAAIPAPPEEPPSAAEVQAFQRPVSK
jgi:hypothetical protein